MRAKLRGIADFHVQIARDWSVGALLFVLLFASRPDLGSLVFVALIVIFALAMFFVPQVYLREVIVRAHRRATSIALEGWREREQTDARTGSSDAELIATLSEVTSAPNYWVYGSGQFAMWGIAQLTAVVALTAQLWDVLPTA